MLTAKLSSGKVISLVDSFARTTLENLRKQERFYCRGCSARVILKLGTKRIYHFAHEKGTICIADYDRESEYHMKGKIQLFKWLQDKGLSPELEKYFPNIKQRADIVFRYEGKIYCLEYQCSTISEEQFRKRTEGYQKASLVPFWILGGNNIHRIGPLKVSFSSFHYLFLRESSNNRYYLHAYCPQANLFITLENFIPVSTRKAYCHFNFKNLMELKPPDLLNSSSPYTLNQEAWRKDMMKFKSQLLANNASIQDPFLLGLYTHSLNLYFIPPFVGLPLRTNFAIETAPFIWQTYIFLDFLHRPHKGKEIYFHEIYTMVLKRVRDQQIKVRALPCIRKNLLPFAIDDYLTTLSNNGILRKIKNNIFVLDKPINIANNMEDWLRQDEMFYQKYLLKQ